MFIIGCATIFSWMLGLFQLPRLIAESLLGLTHNKYVLLMIVNVMLLGFGCVMDMGPLILILTPILGPMMRQVGVDPIHFGIIMILNLGIGLCTPPVGTALFAGCAVAETSVERTSKALLPFYAALVCVLILVTYVPSLSLWLPMKLLGYVPLGAAP